VKSSVSADCSQLPIVVLTFVGAPTLGDLEIALRVFDDLLRRRVRYVLVMDVIEMGVIASSLRQRAARWLIENASAVAHCCVGVVSVATSPLARAAVVAMEWLDPRGDKYVIVDTFDEAMRRARQRLAVLGEERTER
jgi:hypothetical protein